MAEKKDIWTVPHGDGWANRSTGNQRVTRTYDRKEDATMDGRQTAIARGVEHVILKKDGDIGARNTYPRSRDPHSSKG